MSGPEWRDAARADLLSIVSYIAEDNPDAAQRLLDEIRGKTGRLPEHPKLYRSGRVVGTREMVCGNYVIVYAETEERIVILRVLHGRQEWPR